MEEDDDESGRGRAEDDIGGEEWRYVRIGLFGLGYSLW